MFNWVMEFLCGRSIQVRIGSEISRKCLVENGTPQGSVISPVLFNVMINDIFSEVRPGIGKSYLQMMVVYGKGEKMFHLLLGKYKRLCLK